MSHHRIKRQNHLQINGPMRKLISKSNNNASEPSPFENASFTDPQLPTESDASAQSSTSNPQLVPQLQPSTHQMVTRLPPDSAWNELTQMIYNFQCDYRLSKKATNELLKVMDAARRFPDERLNMDWRTVLRHKTKHELELLKRSVGSNDAAKGNFSDDIFVCSKCAVTAFTLMEIQAAPECSACQVSAVLCSFRFCQTMCVCTSRLGHRSINSLLECRVCLLSSNSAYTARSYVLDLKKSIQSVFLNSDVSRNALAPWSADGHQFYAGGTDGMPVAPCDDWLPKWRGHVRSLPYKSESWHGERFLTHPIWQEHGMRSLLLALYLDWVPPFDPGNPYTVGILSVSILNFSCYEKARTGAIWPLMVLSGPSQVPRMFSTMKDVLVAVNDMYVNGIVVFDDLTKSQLRVHVAVAQVVADRPAASKIGEYKAHSAYFGCHRCHYKASVCAHVRLPDDTNEDPVVYDNANFDPQTMTEDDRVLISGEARKKRSGEHLVWLEPELIPRHKLMDEDDLTTSQFEIHNVLTNIPTSWTKTKLSDWLSQQRFNGLSPLVLIDHFSLVNDIVLDGMHLFFKGLNYQLGRLTLIPKEYSDKPWNLHSTNNVPKFEVRMTRFLLPEKVERNNDIAFKISGINAAPMFDFIKVQALLALENLVPANVWLVWKHMVELTCGILHTHVPKEWITNPDGLALSVKKLVLAFQQLYGVCAMSPNWHLLLHLATDFETWSSLRTHWAFGSERLNHELIADIRAISQAHVDASIASASVKYSSMTVLGKRLKTPNEFHIHRHTFDPSHKHTPEMESYLHGGFRTLKSGRIHSLSGKVLAFGMGDVMWLFDPRSSLVSANSERNLYLVSVVAGSQNGQKFVFGVSQVVGVEKRLGHSNTFNWTPNNATQAQQLVTVIHSECGLVCEHVAVYNESGYKKVLVPCCGNLPY